MFDKLTESEQKFIEFVNMLGSTALYQMGKITNPINGKTEKDLNAAQMTIDILSMLKEKTKGNLTQNEQKVLEEFLNHLQMNFVEESKIANQNPPDEKKPEPPQEPKEQDAPKEETSPKKETPATDDDIVLNWEKHERKTYGKPDESK